MKIKVTMKDPDGIDRALEDAIQDNPEQEAEIRRAFEQTFKYGEYFTVNIDTREVSP
jgi:restriction endonuclease S subunit